MFTVGNNKVTFSHDMTLTEETNGNTLCKIYNVETEEVLSTGMAFVSLKDNFDRNTGRKVALAKALKKLNLTSEERLVYWEEYFKRRHGRW